MKNWLQCAHRLFNRFSHIQPSRRTHLCPRSHYSIKGKGTLYIKISAHFVKKVTTLDHWETDVMVSFDTNSLFTRVPIQEALEKRLLEDETLDKQTLMSPSTICNLTEICMRSTYFEFDECLYEHIEGAPMGSPLSSVLADQCVESLIWDYSHRNSWLTPLPCGYAMWMTSGLMARTIKTTSFPKERAQQPHDICVQKANPHTLLLWFQIQPPPQSQLSNTSPTEPRMYGTLAKWKLNSTTFKVSSLTITPQT